MVVEKAVASSGASSGKAYTGVYQSMVKIYSEEGLLAFWKGNFTNVVRIFPYSACQLMANDAYKRAFASSPKEKDGKLAVSTRLLAGALAGMTASTATHPLDTVRLRLAMPKVSEREKESFICLIQC